MRVLPLAYPDGGLTDCLTIGYQAWTPSLPYTFYGDAVSLQKQAFVYINATQLGYASTVPYNANLHITDNYRFGGRLTTTGGSNYPGQYMWFTTGTQLALYSSESAKYTLTGDILQTYTGTINGTLTVNIQWSTGDGIKVVK